MSKLFSPSRETVTKGLFQPDRPPKRGFFVPNQDGDPDEPPISFVPSLFPDHEEAVTPADFKVRRKFHPLVLFFLGRRGAGKTLAMTYLAKYMQSVYRNTGSNRRIFSTYWLSFADECGPRLIDGMYQDPFAYQKSIVVIDEIADFVPSKRAMSGFVTNFESWIRQIRKFQIEVLMATQHPTDITRSVLRQCDLFARCRSIFDGRHVDLDIYDWWGNYTGDQRPKAWPPEPDTHDWEKTLVNTHQVWGDYDTEEFVANRHSQYYEQQVASTWDEAPAEDATPAPPSQPVVTDSATDRIGKWPNEIRIIARAKELGLTRKELEARFGETGEFERKGKVWVRSE